MMRLIDADALCEALLDRWSIADTHKEKLIQAVMADVVTPIVVSQPTVPQWIPCGERLPEKDGAYLVACDTKSKYNPYVYDVMTFANDLYQIDEYDFCNRKGEKGWFYCDREYGFLEDYSVVAWMPLPEYYNENNDEMINTILKPFVVEQPYNVASGEFYMSSAKVEENNDEIN